MAQSKKKPTWGVVCTALEPPALLAAFVAHHLAIGASRVHLIIDQPNQEIEALFAQVPECQLNVGDEEFCQTHLGGAKSDRIFRRQRLNASWAAHTTDVDWLLHVDADEFLHASDFAAVLAALPDEVDAVCLPNVERVYCDVNEAADDSSIFAGGFRRQITDEAAQNLLLSEEQRNFTIGGFCGHHFGKSATRTGRGHGIGIHRPIRRTAPQVLTVNQPLVCHFDGLTRTHWVRKLLRYAGKGIYEQPPAHAVPRHNQMLYIQEHAGDPKVAAELHDRLRVLGPDAADRFAALGYLERFDLGIEQAVANLFPTENIDLTVAAFDAYLDRSEREFSKPKG